LQATGFAALAWVSWGWLDARLYQTQQERLLSESIGLLRLEQHAAQRDVAATGGWDVGGGTDRATGSRPHGGPRAGTSVEIVGAGPAVVVEPAKPSAAPGQTAAPRATPPPPEAAPVRPSKSSPVAAAAESPVTDLAMGRLEVPRLGMRVMVAPGVDTRSLRRAAGHIPGTAAPGGDGNVGIAGHRDTFFRPLRRVEVGDEIVLETAEGVARYVVEWTDVVPPAAVEVLAPTGYPALTLVTCYPFTFVGNAPDRFIVRARRVETRTAADLLDG
jgi:sortase A